MSTLLKKAVKTKMTEIFTAKKEERKKKLIQDKGAYKVLSSKGVGASEVAGAE